MNFIESTSFFVRVTMYDLIHQPRTSKVRFRIIPMIHIGSEQYYQQVFQYLNECDEVIYEGTYCKRLTHIFALRKRIAQKLGLVTQSDYLKLKQLDTILIHADFAQEMSNREWQKLEWKEKLYAYLVIPFVQWINSYSISRKDFGNRFMTTAMEAYLAFGSSETEPRTFRSFVMNAREQIIYQKMGERLLEPAPKEKLIGIVYGAGHMKSITRFLIDKCNYFVRSGEFIEVFKVI